MVNLPRFLRPLSRKVGSLPRKTKDQETTGEWTDWQHADLLSKISAAIHHGCMGLPQELVEHIMDMLYDDIGALKASSLTCKAMFVSARHLVHRRLCLTPANTLRILTQRERSLYLEGEYQDQLRFLSYMGERGFLRYAREVDVRTLHMFTPDTLLPHLHHFRSLDRVHALTVDHFDTVPWQTHFNTCFAHFYPTLTSLTLHRPLGHYRLILQFALQFPNLENLCLAWLRSEQIQPGATPPVLDERFPPLGGHLRLVGFNDSTQWPKRFVEEVGSGMNFRSVELELEYFGNNAQLMLNACADTVENLTIVPRETIFDQFRSLEFKQLTVLRRLTLRMVYTRMFSLAFTFLPILTVSSPVFSEFVLELGGLPFPSREYRGRWEETDRFLEQRFAKHGDFELIIRTRGLHDWETFQTHAKESFPLLESRGCIRFETPHLTAGKCRY